jgi:hypothetical protein
VGEDNAFVWSPEPKWMAINMRDELVATIHRGNTSPKSTTGQRWRELHTHTSCRPFYGSVTLGGHPK